MPPRRPPPDQEGRGTATGCLGAAALIILLLLSAAGGLPNGVTAVAPHSSHASGPTQSAADPTTKVGLRVASAFRPGRLGPRPRGMPLVIDPAPMGISDLGLTANGTDEYTTDSFEGTANVYDLVVSGDSGPNMTFQLNLNLGFEDGGSWYHYWVQDVAGVNTATERVVDFADQIWNVSASSSVVYSTTVVGNGEVFSPGFYDYGVSTPSGYVTFPGTFSLRINSTLSLLDEPELEFQYDTGGGFVTFDVVTFEFAVQLDYSDNFVVDGGNNLPTNLLPYDAEFVLGGPGNGEAVADNQSDVLVSLAEWNGNNYESIRNAYDYGTDTAESITYADVTAERSPENGSLSALVRPGLATLGPLWYATQVAIVEAEGPGSCNAELEAGTGATPYLDGNGTIAIASISLNLAIVCGPDVDAFGSYSLAAGSTTVLNTSYWEDLEFIEKGLPTSTEWGISIGSENITSVGTHLYYALPAGNYTFYVSGGGTNLPSPSLDIAYDFYPEPTIVEVMWQPVAVTSNVSSSELDARQSVEFSVPLTGPVGGFGYVWNDVPPGCGGVNAESVDCVPMGGGTFNVTVTVSNGYGFSVVSAGLTFTVYFDPEVAISAAPHTSADAGQSFSFSAVPRLGSGGYRFTWSGLPSGCRASTPSGVNCSASEPGSYSVRVGIVDSNGYPAKATLDFPIYAELVVVLTSSSTSFLEGATITLTATVSGGAGEFTYDWGGLPPGCAAPSGSEIACTPAASGGFDVLVTVTDQDGGSNSTNLTLSVAPTTLGLPQSQGDLLVVVLGATGGAAAIAAAAAFLVRRRARSRL